ncbi:MAG: hypothetical protein JU82_10815 [Sulfuricurvum sp. MLSB]|uniref:hypothetical protein n=1 Tax=unclassified Sulfuricurvum TaxID=2632390 RepID=UPI0005046724|nr:MULTISPECIES: hypothetical protein [unclassified Sulfuricurvum]KFN38609.1 MAG: hypothetical protein JU82_10815 [Sulfuricurvum sp. MLSB]
MSDIIREAYTRFHEVDGLLKTAGAKDDGYFKQLSEATQNAYVAMNEGMCENTTVCHDCASHRDFLHTMIGIVEDLASGAPLSNTYKVQLDLYGAKVSEILKKIEKVIAST